MARVAFLFDCDGTLIDSMAAWHAVETGLADRVGVVLSAAEKDEVVAATIPEVGRMFHERWGLGSSADDVVGMIDEGMMDYYRHHCQARPGAVQAVRAMVQRGVPCAVTSTSPQRYLQAGLAHIGLDDAFSCVLSVDDVGHSKREPHIYLRALDEMDAQVEGSWGVDDSTYALNAMAATGLNTVGIYDNDISGPFDELQRASTLAIVSFDEWDTTVLRMLDE